MNSGKTNLHALLNSRYGAVCCTFEQDEKYFLKVNKIIEEKYKLEARRKKIERVKMINNE